jgi:hypothetical protein
VWQHIARLNKTLMSSSSISTSGMSRTWSELAVSASKLNIVKYSEAKESSQPPSRAPAQQMVLPSGIHPGLLFSAFAKSCNSLWPWGPTDDLQPLLSNIRETIRLPSMAEFDDAHQLDVLHDVLASKPQLSNRSEGCKSLKFNNRKEQPGNLDSENLLHT